MLSPGAAQRRVQRHDAVVEQPDDESGRQVPSEVIHDRQHPHWCQLVTQGGLDGQTRLPALPGGSVVVVLHPDHRRQRVDDGCQLSFQPGMQHHVRTAGHAFDADLASAPDEESQQLGGAVTYRVYGVPSRPTDRLPMRRSLGMSCSSVKRMIGTAPRPARAPPAPRSARRPRCGCCPRLEHCTSSGAVQLSCVKLSCANQANDQPVTMGLPADWRAGEK